MTYSLFRILKNHSCKFQSTWHSFFAYSLFQILKKEYFQILAHFFIYSLFYKKHTYESQITWHSFFCLLPFSSIKKRILLNLSRVFYLFSFSNIKKSYLRISKYLTQFVFLFSFPNIMKRLFTNLSTDCLLIPFFKY